MLKTCTKCHKELDVSEFYKNKNKKDGLDSWCKYCTSANRTKYYQNKSNREYKRKWDREYYKKNKTYRTSTKLCAEV